MLLFDVCLSVCRVSVPERPRKIK